MSDIKVEFTLTMEDLIVNGEPVEQVIIQWQETLSQKEVLELSHQWITSKNFLTSRMEGLTRVGDSSLTIEPIEEDEPSSLDAD